MAITGLAEVVLNVRDMDRALGFYRDLLGLQVDSPPQLSSPVFLRAGESGPGVPALAVLVRLPDGAAAFSIPKPLHHLAFSVNPGSLPVLRELLESRGIEVRFGQHPTLGLRTMYAFDPDGNEVEFIAPD